MALCPRADPMKVPPKAHPLPCSLLPLPSLAAPGGRGRGRWEASGCGEREPIHLRHRPQQQHDFQTGDVIAVQAEGRTRGGLIASNMG